MESTLFNGANSRILVRTAAGEQIEADLPQHGADASFEKGEPVVLTWERAGSKCFARAGEGRRRMTPTRQVARSFPVAPDRESGFMKERHEAMTGTPNPARISAAAAGSW